MAVKFAASFDTVVTILSKSPSKETDAKRLGAHHFTLTSDEYECKHVAGYFDFIIDTVSASHNYEKYMSLLKNSDVLIILGVMTDPTQIAPIPMIFARKSLVGSLIRRLPETQEMLDYCAEHSITSDVEVISIQQI